MYKCLDCGKEVDEESAKEKIRCPYCGFRIIVKARGKKITRVKAE